MNKDELPYINTKYSCDDLYWWRQEILEIYDRKQQAQEKQMRKHQ